MGDYLLHENAEVLCEHTGQATPDTTDLRVSVSGNMVVTQLDTYTVGGCKLPPPPNGNGPCVSALWTSAATRVKASGQPVLLANSEATCAPTGAGLQVMTTQTRVKGT